jgi:hypothetical protein
LEVSRPLNFVAPTVALPARPTVNEFSGGGTTEPFGRVPQGFPGPTRPTAVARGIHHTSADIQDLYVKAQFRPTGAGGAFATARTRSADRFKVPTIGENSRAQYPYFIIIPEGQKMRQLKRLSAALMAAMFMSLVGCAGTRTQESTGQYLDDASITTKVKAAILKDPELKVTEINVETYKGIVQLSGFVSSKADADKAVEVARGVKGVKSVQNDMRLKSQ